MSPLKRILAAVLLAVCGATAAYAQSSDNDQKVVIGIGLGLHSFSGGDDVRDNAFLLLPNTAGMSQLYVEWYVFGRFGIGARMLGLSMQEQAMFGSLTLTSKVTVSNDLITLHYLPFISDSKYARIGLIAGAGSSTYEFSQSVGAASASNSAKGSASLIQVYVDWGGEDFGARFGVGALRTSLGDMPGLVPPLHHVDASGTHAYLDLRWAF